MNPYEDEERRRQEGEKLLRVTEEARKADRGSRIKFPEFFKKLPVKSLLIGGLIICACLIGLALSERVRGISADVNQMKAQLKGQVAGLEAKLEQGTKENEQLKNELTQVKTELEGLKAENQKRVAQQTKAAAVKKAVAAKKQKRKS
jgi:hypothetical protein